MFFAVGAPLSLNNRLCLYQSVLLGASVFQGRVDCDRIGLGGAFHKTTEQRDYWKEKQYFVVILMHPRNGHVTQRLGSGFGTESKGHGCQHTGVARLPTQLFRVRRAKAHTVGEAIKLSRFPLMGGVSIYNNHGAGGRTPQSC